MPRVLTVLVAGLSLALVAGCGSSDKKKSKTASSSGAPVSKAEYEKRLVAGLRPARGTGLLASRITKTSSPASDARVFDQVGAIYQKAYNAIRPIVPPKDIANVHSQVVAAYQQLAQASNRARDVLRKNERGAQYTAALKNIRAQNAKLQSLARQLTARGY